MREILLFIQCTAVNVPIHFILMKIFYFAITHRLSLTSSQCCENGLFLMTDILLTIHDLNPSLATKIFVSEDTCYNLNCQYAMQNEGKLLTGDS